MPAGQNTNVEHLETQVTKLDRYLGRIAFRNRRRRPKFSKWLRNRLPERQMKIGKVFVNLHPADNFTEFAAWNKGFWPERESINQLIKIVCNRKSLIIDLGANCGSFSTALAAEMAAGSRVIAVEANPEMAERLRQNIELNNQSDHIEVVNAAVGGDRGFAQLTLNNINLGEASLKGFSRYKGGEISVRVLPLADLMQGYDRYDQIVLKIDIEGFEDEVLMPYFNTKNKYPLPDFILIEVANRDQWAQDLLSKMKSKGYKSIFSGNGNSLFELAKTAMLPNFRKEIC